MGVCGCVVSLSLYFVDCGIQHCMLCYTMYDAVKVCYICSYGYISNGTTCTSKYLCCGTEYFKMGYVIHGNREEYLKCAQCQRKSDYFTY